MAALTSVILPVFLVIGLGWVAAWRGWMTEGGVDGLMIFTQQFAIPALLFSAIAGLDLSVALNPGLLLSFYLGATAGFLAGLFGGRLLFKRSWEDSVAIGFCCLFSNSVLLGLPITERAYGTEVLATNFAIIAIHAPFCYVVGIIAMEVARSRGAPAKEVPGKILSAVFHNVLILAILAGFAVNLLAIPLPAILTDALDLLIRAALPAALFGLGGVLFRYRPEGDMRAIFYVCAVSLILHPAVTLGLTHAFDLPLDIQRPAVLTAAMAPGINAYIFANMYGAARRVAASSVLFATGLSIFSAWAWLSLLG